MPTYDNECKACGHIFETFQPMSAKPIKKCPKCKKMKVNRLIGGGVGVIFKGPGWTPKHHNCGSCRSGNCGSCGS